MKKILLAVMAIISMTANAQKGCFEKPVSGFTASLSTIMGGESRFGLEAGYTHEDFFFGYLTASMGAHSEGYVTYEAPGVGLGFDYTFIQYNQIGIYLGAEGGYRYMSGSFPTELSAADYIAPRGIDAYYTSFDVGVKIEAVKNVFLKAGWGYTFVNYDRLALSVDKVGVSQHNTMNATIGVSFVF